MKNYQIRKRIFAAIKVLFSPERSHYVLTIAKAEGVWGEVQPRRRLCRINSWPDLIGLDSTPLAIAERGKPNLGYKDVILMRFGESNYCQWFGRAPLGEQIPIGRVMEIYEVIYQKVKKT